MKYPSALASLLLSVALITAPGAVSPAFAHPGEKDLQCMDGKHHAPLSDPLQKSLHKAMKDLEEKNQQAYQDTLRLHNKLNEILTAPKFDKKAYLDVMKQIQKHHEHMELAGFTAFANLADKIPPQLREHVSMMLMHPHPGMPPVENGEMRAPPPPVVNHEFMPPPPVEQPTSLPTTIGQPPQVEDQKDYPPFAIK